MPKLERYSSFEEMDEAQVRDQAMAKGKRIKVKKQNTIQAFAALLRKNVVDTTKPKGNKNTK